MPIDKVIELGKAIQKPELDKLAELNPTFLFLLVSIGVIVIGLMIFGVVKEEEEIISRSVVGLIFIIVVSIMTNMYATSGAEATQMIKYNTLIAEWKKDVVKPYIESLPIEKRDVKYVKIDPELGVKTSRNNVGHIGFTNLEPVERTALVVGYRDEGKLVITTNWFETDMPLTDDGKLYIEFQRLTKSLGHGVDKGIYNPKVYIPDSYEFTEIK